MSIEKITLQQSLNIKEFNAVYKRTAAAETEKINKNSFEAAETFDIDKQVQERFVEISDKALEKKKRLEVASPEMERIINRIKTSALSYKRKEMLLRQVWAKVRTESLNAKQGSINANAQTKANPNSIHDYEESFYDMIRTFESVESKKLDFNEMSKDIAKLDDIIDKLHTEDELFEEQANAVSELVNNVKQYDDISQKIISAEWNFDASIEMEN